MEKYKYNRFVVTLNDETSTFIKKAAEARGLAPTAFIKNIIGEYKESHDKDKRAQ